MKKIKIVHFITSLNRGGAEAFLVDLLLELSPEFENHVFYFHPGPHVDDLKNHGIKTYQVRGAFTTYDPIFLFRLLYQIYTLKPQLIHSLLWSAHLVAKICGKLLKIPVISALHSHEELSGQKKDKSSLIRKTLTNIMSNKATHYICVSNEIANQLRQRYPKIDPCTITTIENGINHRKFQDEIGRAATTKETLGYTNDHLIIGTVGRFVTIKNQSLLIDVFANLYKKYPFLRLLIVGYGSLENKLSDQIFNHNIANVARLIINEKATKYYPIFDIFALTSHSEGISIALLEAMVAALACVVTSGNQSHEVIKDGINGLIVEPNQNDLERALILLIEQTNLRNKLGRLAYQDIKEKFDIQFVVKKYEKIFSEKYKGAEKILN